MKSVSIAISMLILVQNLLGQENNLFEKGQFQLYLGFSLMPIQQKSAQVQFQYIDGDNNANYPVDTITADYNLKRKYFGNVICLGLGYFINDNFRISANIKPHINSFRSNQAKNKKVYGVQFDMGVDYFAHLSPDISLSFGSTLSRIIGGFGIISGGAKNKDHLLVNGNKLYDNDIGFHIIDNHWGISPKIGLNYKLSNNWIVFANTGYQITFSQTSKMNFAGLLEDGTVKWNSKSYDSPDVDLIIDNLQINTQNIKKLPFRYSGIFFDLGLMLKLNQ
jgi:Outer membrane protein beta-barrel domain